MVRPIEPETVGPDLGLWWETIASVAVVCGFMFFAAFTAAVVLE